MFLTIELTINGQKKKLAAKPGQTLLSFLRELGYTGVKEGCGKGECGACTVLVDGQPVNACLYLAVQAQGKEILTIEGLAQQGRLHPLQEAFISESALQCGYCTPGMILTAKALLDKNPRASEEEIAHAIAGNLCRCTGYSKIIKAIKKAGEVMADNVRI
ncbi:(2Fe-2S)-binding protein [Zhaonella formicivorans]|uniref:(2Fe-2S)-binding protein n=1 Tax=Zhaonella formicivorans TaxID=2528593 RepID=UPI0010D2864B|nr:(2Fe-2S)-binding protein [Zhaonella formicivorans]